LNNGKTFLHPTYVGDLLKLFEKLLKKRIKNDVFIIAGERYVTVNEFINIIAEELNVKIKKIKIPLFFAKFSGYMAESFKELFNVQTPLTRSTVSFFCENHAFDISKARKKLNYVPVNLEEGIKTTIKWYTKNGIL
jgi:nucleoside-diphosphate-sugar epimerase